MEHFFEGIAPLRHWYINPNEKSNKYKSSELTYQSLKRALCLCLDGNLSLPFNNKVSDWALNYKLFLVLCCGASSCHLYIGTRKDFLIFTMLGDEV